MKLFNTSEDIQNLADDKFGYSELGQIGINLKVVSTPKAKNILKAQRANPTTQFLTKKDVILTVYEKAFDRLTDEQKSIMMEGVISNIAYDSEKDKLSVDNDFAREIFRMRKKYPNYVDIAELSYAIIEEIEEEERKQKEEEKIRKADEKAAKKRMAKYGS